MAMMRTPPGKLPLVETEEEVFPVHYTRDRVKEADQDPLRAQGDHKEVDLSTKHSLRERALENELNSVEEKEDASFELKINNGTVSLDSSYITHLGAKILQLALADSTIKRLELNCCTFESGPDAINVLKVGLQNRELVMQLDLSFTPEQLKTTGIGVSLLRLRKNMPTRLLLDSKTANVLESVSGEESVFQKSSKTPADRILPGSPAQRLAQRGASFLASSDEKKSAISLQSRSVASQGRSDERVSASLPPLDYAFGQVKVRRHAERPIIDVSAGIESGLSSNPNSRLSRPRRREDRPILGGVEIHPVQYSRPTGKT